MGTNFYLKNDSGIMLISGESANCNELHIGKSSGGWCFSLHVHPELDIRDLDDWVAILADPANRIENEYGATIGCEEMLATITERAWGDDFKWNKPIHDRFYSSWPDFFTRNQAEPGPNGLLRHRVEGDPNGERFSFQNGCIKHGEGTWDCIVGDFS